MDARELLIAELFEQVLQRAAQEVAARGRVDVHVVVAGLEPFDGRAVDELQRLADGHEQPIVRLRLGASRRNGGARLSHLPVATRMRDSVFNSRSLSYGFSR